MSDTSIMPRSTPVSGLPARANERPASGSAEELEETGRASEEVLAAAAAAAAAASATSVVHVDVHDGMLPDVVNHQQRLVAVDEAAE